jgi:DNA-binding NarL/FixJ family response regulator
VSRPIRVLVVDDQAAVRGGFVVLLELVDGVEVVGSGRNGEEAVTLSRELKPDVVLLDLRMPVMDGIEATRRIEASHPQTAVVVLTTYADDESVVAALRAGATSYLTKNSTQEDIGQALRSATRGLSMFSPDAYAAVLATTRPPQDAELLRARLPDGLTSREAEVLTLIGRGFTNETIAAELCLSRHTVKTHVSHIFAKTGSANRDEAAAYARRHRFVGAEPGEAWGRRPGS